MHMAASVRETPAAYTSNNSTALELNWNKNNSQVSYRNQIFNLETQHVLSSQTFQRWSLFTIRFCRLDIRQDSAFATGNGYPKTAFKREPYTDPDIPNAFIDISTIQTFGKSCTLRNYSFLFSEASFQSFLCHDPESVYVVISVL